MKYFLFSILLACSVKAFGNHNLALKFDGKDDQVDLFMAPLLNEWTISAWVYKENGDWSGDNLIVSGLTGVKEWEDCPLYVKDGFINVRLCKLKSTKKLTKGWNHIATSWDGKVLTVFLNGKNVGQQVGGKPVCPAFIGSKDGRYHFQGLVDEVRIWNKAIPEEQISVWLNREINPTHPYYNSLTAYYRFDDSALDATDYAGDNKADIKNYYKSKDENNGPEYVNVKDREFKFSAENKSLYKTILKTVSLPVLAGQKNIEIEKWKLNVQGNRGSLYLTELKVRLSKSFESSAENLLLKFHSVNAEDANQPIKSTVTMEGDYTIFKFSQPISLPNGISYFSLNADIQIKPLFNSKLKLQSAITMANGKSIKLNVSEGRTIKAPSSNNELKVLNWNIWHGGIEKGKRRGVTEIIDIIRQVDADVITMVETYGSGQRISKELGYHFYEPYENSNLSIISRYPIIKTIKSKVHSFVSTGVIIEMPSKQQVLIWAIWIPYWPGNYARQQYSDQYTVEDWIKGDEKYSLPKMKEIIEKDLKGLIADEKTTFILSGDFNTISHLDMTKKAADAGLHGGFFGEFPVSKEILSHGFKDSYRQINSDEVAHHGGTWAAIFKWCNDFRIDYIYYKGTGITPIESRTIEENARGDVLWPGDHSAVFTKFRIN